MNDPNGLVYADGEYHLFFQSHPHDVVWGPMHWGHAVSADLLSWQHRPVSLWPDERGTIFSGSAVVDAEGTGGFGRRALVAVFTYHDDTTTVANESQAIAWSHDRGLTFSKFAHNPVIAAVAEQPHTRDPKVFWYSNGETAHWVMALAAAQEVWIFTSSNLRSWERTDVVGGFDITDELLECPDLFELKDEAGTSQWALIASVTDGPPTPGGGVVVWFGQFDGSRFTPDSDVRRVDHGAAFYAAQSWNDVPDGRRIWIGWMANWANQSCVTTGAEWCGQMSLPRQLTLRSRDGDPYLVQQPVREIELLRNDGRIRRSVMISCRRGEQPWSINLRTSGPPAKIGIVEVYPLRRAVS